MVRLISTRIALVALLGCASCASRGSSPPGSSNAPPPVSASPVGGPKTVGRLSIVERAVMDMPTGKPTDSAATIDAYVARLRRLPQRPDGASVPEHGVADLTVELVEGKTIVIRRGKTEVHRRVLPEERQRFQPEQLLAWNGHWVFEYDGDVVVDGQSLAARGDYREVFGWMLVASEPLYFFVKDGRAGVSHGGDVMPLSYDDVLHGGCCELAAFNPISTSWGVRFHARRGVTWYYVELGTP